MTPDAKPSLSTQTLADVLDVLAAGTPSPGGGSAAAIGGALGTTLLIMVASLPKTRTGSADEATRMAGAAASLRTLRARLLALADDDQSLYAGVTAAYRLPKADAAGQDARRAAIDAALQSATDGPLDVMRACLQAMQAGVGIVTCARRSAAGDAAVGIELLWAGLRGAGICVDENLPAIGTAGYVASAGHERRRIETEANEARATFRSAVDTP